MIKSASRAITCSRWLLPLFSLGLGLVVFVVSWLGGQFGAGLGSLAILAAFGLLILLLTGRSETVRGLTVARDERFAQIDQRATAAAGLVVLVTLIVAVPVSPSVLRSRATSIRTAGFLFRAWRIAASAETGSRPLTDCSPSIISIGV